MSPPQPHPRWATGEESSEQGENAASLHTPYFGHERVFYTISWALFPSKPLPAETQIEIYSIHSLTSLSLRAADGQIIWKG